MDDDDYYYETSVELRIKELINSKKDIVACTIVGCFNINKGISYIESSNINDNYADRIYCYYFASINHYGKKLKFDNESINEAHSLINKNLHKFRKTYLGKYNCIIGA